MSEYVFDAKSSKEGSYPVHFMVADEELHAHCGCPAGSFGKICKHVLGLASGDQSLLYDETQLPILDELSSVLAQTSFYQHLQDWKEADRILRQAKRQADSAKSKLKKKIILGE